MYEEFYGLSEKPFSIQPDPSFLYWGRGHRLAYAMLEYGVLNHAGISVVTGEVGCGKTTLIHRLLEQLSDTHTVALLSNIQPGRGDLLSWVLMGFGESYAGKTHVEMFSQLQNYFISEYAKGRRVVLIIDEAQNLTVDMLEEIRMLSNINAGKDQLLQLILVGQPQLKELLSRPDMLQLAQRIGSDFHLTPLSREEVHAYIDARLTIAGARRRIFTEKAMDLVAEQSRGVPRVINVIADTALVYAFSAEDLVVDEETIRSVVRDKLEYGVFGLANSPDLKLSEKRADAPEKKTAASFLREVRTEPTPDDAPEYSRGPAPTRVEPMDAPRVLRAAGAKGGPRLAAAPEVVEDDEEEERAAIPFGGPSLYSNLDAAPYARSEPDFAPAIQEPPVEAGAVASVATMEELGIIIVGGDADAAATAPEGAHLVFVAADDVAQETARAAGVDVVEIADGAASGGRARNAGYRRLKKIAPGLKFVQFVDAADTLDPEWLGRALRFMARRPEVAVLEGEIDEGDEARSVFQRVRETAARKLDGEIQAAGPTALFRAEAFEAAGGFRSDILVDETADLCLRLRRRGAHVWRLDDVMAYRIEHRMKFGEYWRRTRENGFQYAAGAALHGAPPEHFCVTEQARAVMWGMVFPAVVVFAAVAAAVAAIVLKTIGDPVVIGAGVLAVGGVIYFAKIFVTAFRLGPFRGFSWTYGFVSTIGHFAEFLGVARYWFGGKPQPSSRRSA